MKTAAETGRHYTLKGLSRSINRPAITLGAIALALGLGALRFPFLEYLRPVGDFYIALLQICVLPFLLATIPLAVRSAMAGESAPGALRALLFWILATMIVVVTISVAIPNLFFSYVAPDERMMNNIGTLLGRSANGIDVEFAIGAGHATEMRDAGDVGIFAVIPTNIFASLSSNDSVRVLVFAVIFGIGMVLTERDSGHSIFDALRHIQAVCTLIFDWFSLLVPIGIVALVSPQVARLGPDAFSALTLLAYPLLATGVLLLVVTPLFCAIALGTSAATVFGALLKPITLAASTRNSLICVPLALETLKTDLRVRHETCDLYVPIGIATLRFGTMLYFVIATLFMGTLMGRQFSLMDLVSLAVFSVGASFATIGVSGLAALAPLAIVLRPFGLSYEVAVPLMIIIDPLADMIRTMLNVALNCMIPALVGRHEPLPASPSFRGSLGLTPRT